MPKNILFITFILLVPPVINFNGILALSIQSDVKSKSADIECTKDAECIGVDGLKCIEGLCLCPTGKFLHQDTCITVSPYLMSNCTLDVQCERLKFGYKCDEVMHKCVCKSGWRYLNGRCWPILEFGDKCETKEQCFHPLQPFSLDCIEGSCKCADGYYNRQDNECRRISTELGRGCVIDSDCQIVDAPTAVCSKDLKCVKPETNIINYNNNFNDERVDIGNVGRIKLDDACSKDDDCKPLGEAECSKQRHCICKIGYYPNTDNAFCLAELGMPVPDNKTCAGAGAVVVDGICDCPVGFFYDSSSNRNCKKPARSFDDSCADDSFCYTFGKAGQCVQYDDSIFKHCRCNESISYKDDKLSMCVLFNKIVGDSCDPDKHICPLNSECLDNECRCIDDMIALPDKSICVESDLELNSACVLDEQCSTNYSACIDKKCTCQENYFEKDDECKIAINGPCFVDDDCEIENSICANNTDMFNEQTSKCACMENYIHDNYRECLKIAANFSEECEKPVQCWGQLGDDTSVNCEGNKCVCTENYHPSWDRCWKKNLLGEVCANPNECYVESGRETVECRNSKCQCVIGYEEVSPFRCNGSTSLFGSQTMFISWMLLAYVLYSML